MSNKPLRRRRISLLLVTSLMLLSACGGGGSGGGSSPTATVTATPNPTRILSATATATASLTPTATPTPTTTAIPLAEAIARDGDGNAVHLGETLTVEGVVTVAAGVLANNKLRVFMQDGADGILVFHQSAGDVDAFQAGDQLRARGVIRQHDPTGGDVPLLGTVMVDLTGGSWSLLSQGNPLPAPAPISLAELAANGNPYVGSLVRVEDVRKLEEDAWPLLGSKTKEVRITDDNGVTLLPLRFQRNTITQDMVDKLAAIGNDVFAVVGIAVQDDDTDDGKLFDGFQIWVRGADDINP
jgi:hypothetical protein